MRFSSYVSVKKKSVGCVTYKLALLQALSLTTAPWLCHRRVHHVPPSNTFSGHLPFWSYWPKYAPVGHLTQIPNKWHLNINGHVFLLMVTVIICPMTDITAVVVRLVLQRFSVCLLVMSWGILCKPYSIWSGFTKQPEFVFFLKRNYAVNTKNELWIFWANQHFCFAVLFLLIFLYGFLVVYLSLLLSQSGCAKNWKDWLEMCMSKVE